MVGKICGIWLQGCVCSRERRMWWQVHCHDSWRLLDYFVVTCWRVAEGGTTKVCVAQWWPTLLSHAGEPIAVCICRVVEGRTTKVCVGRNDGQLHSYDGHFSLLWCQPDDVYVWRNDMVPSNLMVFAHYRSFPPLLLNGATFGPS